VRGAVLDAFALLAWLAAEEGAATGEGWLEEAERGEAGLFISIINAGEVCYRLLRLGKGREAHSLWQEMLGGGLPLRVMPATPRRVRGAAEVKGRYPIAYADAFAAQLAQELGLPLLTGDPDFRVLEREGLVQVLWLPAP
jgi:predicted nucleic acid-binding protein